MAWTWYPGYREIKYTHSEQPLILPTHGGPDRALPELCKDVVPPCYLNPLLFNGHLQTAWTAVKNQGPSIHYKRRVVASEDPGFKGHFTIDHVVAPPPKEPKKAEDGGLDDSGLREDPTGIGHHRLPPRTTYFTDKEWENIGSDDTKPMLITLHGLSGGSYENYLRQVLEPLVASTSEGEKAGGLSGGEWEALVINSRGCAGSKITTSVLYNARATWDVRQVVKWARKTWPNRPLYAIGYSLGANILTNVGNELVKEGLSDELHVETDLLDQYLGEEGDACVLNAAVIVSNPWQLEVTSLVLRKSWLGRELYLKVMGDHMRNLFGIHRDQILENKALDAERISKLKYLHDFDREVQCATWGYPTVGAYYRDASSADSALGIRVPTFCLHAVDDPIALDIAVPYDEIKENPYLVMCATQSGGHLAWFESDNRRWHSKPIVAFLNEMARKVDFKNFKKPELTAKGPNGGHKTPFKFEPTLKKLHTQDSV